MSENKSSIATAFFCGALAALAVVLSVVQSTGGFSQQRLNPCGSTVEKNRALKAALCTTGTFCPYPATPRWLSIHDAWITPDDQLQMLLDGLRGDES